MTLRNRLLITTTIVVLSLLGVTGASLWVVTWMERNLGLVAEEYDELRLVDHVGNDLATARTLLRAEHPDFVMIQAKLQEASSRLQAFLGMQYEGENDPDHEAEDHEDAERRAAHAISQALGPILDQVRQMADLAGADSVDVDPSAVLESVEQMDTHLKKLADEASALVLSAREKSRTALRRAVFTLTGLCLMAALVGIISGVIQYRTVVPPLARIRDRVREIASGKFDQRLTIRGRDEFAELSEDFNRMVAELESLYHNLEERVEVKSRQLVRSERLASVGYLAAGVAHEINNPLSIIAGYAELALKDLRKQMREVHDTETIQGLEIIHDEAFRCKQIIEKLLSLVRNPDVSRSVVNLGAVAHDVVTMVRGLKQFNGRILSVEIDPSQPLEVLAHEAEMKQVLLNLTINAMEAVNDGDGCVEIRGSLAGGEAELSVIDNGQGMSPQAMTRAFEPFYTDKRSGEHGNGLGLSIVHAIIQDHGGRIEAHSDGPGLGSRFTLHLPVVEKDQEHHGPNQSVA